MDGPTTVMLLIILGAVAVGRKAGGASGTGKGER
jgi:hypothetical protein